VSGGRALRQQGEPKEDQHDFSILLMICIAATVHFEGWNGLPAPVAATGKQ
jgi:hypothetical protein